MYLYMLDIQFASRKKKRPFTLEEPNQGLLSYRPQSRSLPSRPLPEQRGAWREPAPPVFSPF